MAGAEVKAPRRVADATRDAGLESLLEADPTELAKLVDPILINVAAFFRNEEA